MTSATHAELDDIINRIRDWEPTARVHLARRVLETLDSPQISVPPRLLPTEQVFGLLSSDDPVPTDAEARSIMEEERLRKYA